MKCLNVACGTYTAPGWVNLDFSDYARLRKWPRTARLLHAAGLLSTVRWNRLQSIDPGIICHDVRRGLPFPDASFDVVYSAQFLEHLFRTEASRFLHECRRVLRPRGILRLAVPDLEQLIAAYIAADGDLPARLAAIEELFDQMVRVVPSAVVEQGGTIMARIEHLLRGSPADVGELHRWMYDFASLAALLESHGFSQPQRHTAETSAISGWKDFHLDADESGCSYHPHPLYIEAIASAS